MPLVVAAGAGGEGGNPCGRPAGPDGLASIPGLRSGRVRVPAARSACGSHPTPCSEGPVWGPRCPRGAPAAQAAVRWQETGQRWLPARRGRSLWEASAGQGGGGRPGPRTPSSARPAPRPWARLRVL